MFEAKIYQQRRHRLKEQIKEGLILFLGNEESPMNYPSNPYPFRQDSSFLYFFGLDMPGLAAIVDVEADQEILFGEEVSVEDIVWMGILPSLKERASWAGIEEVAPQKDLGKKLKAALQKGQKIHYLPPYRPEVALKIEELLGINHVLVKDYSSRELIKAVVAQRSIKIKEEIEEMEKAHKVTYEMHTTAMRMARPGIYEREIVGKIEGIAYSYGFSLSFPTILTINGQILHNHDHSNILNEGRLLVNDSGAESALHYAADITRTFPVSGQFSPAQREIYEIVLKGQEEAINSIKPGLKFKDIHLKAAKIMASGLKEIGLMTGDIEEAVSQGAHALFFPHGLGHMVGLDVHDMEDLGEEFVGYDEETKRSQQFGLAYLRFARELQPGMVMTVEPGIYFIPALIDQWAAEKKLEQFINYQKVNQYRDFGGIRIEDNVLVTEEGHRVLGKSIPKTVKELEEIVGKS
ncbi:MAG: aminopeptidase P family protein [Candidatus Aminicenantales bacterium]